MSYPQPEPISLLQGRITGFSQIPDGGDLPLIVFLHGGAFDARSTMIPGASQIGLAAENGFPAFALNRPGYMESESLGADGVSDDGYFDASAAVLDAAIAELWQEHGAGRRGVILHGCSIGGAVALTLAARMSDQAHAGSAQWPLLGAAVVDIGYVAPDYIGAAWGSLPNGEFVPVEPAALMSALPSSPPVWAAAQMPGDAPAPIDVPRNELLEVAGGWTRNWRSVAERIRVPVQYRISEWDHLWVVTPQLVAAMETALETASPYVDAGIVRGASHAIHLGPLGGSYNHLWLSFALLTAAAAEAPERLTVRRDATA